MRSPNAGALISLQSGRHPPSSFQELRTAHGCVIAPRLELAFAVCICFLDTWLLCDSATRSCFAEHLRFSGSRFPPPFLTSIPHFPATGHKIMAAAIPLPPVKNSAGSLARKGRKGPNLLHCSTWPKRRQYEILALPSFGNFRPFTRALPSSTPDVQYKRIQSEKIFAHLSVRLPGGWANTVKFHLACPNAPFYLMTHTVEVFYLSHLVALGKLLQNTLLRHRPQSANSSTGTRLMATRGEFDACYPPVSARRDPN